MTTSLIDSNILLDLFQDGPDRAWSLKALVRVGSVSDLMINPVIWAEISVRFKSEEDLEAALSGLTIRKSPLPYEAAFLAGKAHMRYRQSGGSRDRTLPDFLVGAHAVVQGAVLLTRDASRYRTYFPTLDIVAPDTHP